MNLNTYIYINHAPSWLVVERRQALVRGLHRRLQSLQRLADLGEGVVEQGVEEGAGGLRLGGDRQGLLQRPEALEGPGLCYVGGLVAVDEWVGYDICIHLRTYIYMYVPT